MMSWAVRSLCMQFTAMALLCMLVMPARCAGMKTYIPRPWSACAQALMCLARISSQLLSQSWNTSSDLAFSMDCWIWRTELELLMYIVRSHSSLGSRNLCQSEDFISVHFASHPRSPLAQPRIQLCVRYFSGSGCTSTVTSSYLVALRPLGSNELQDRLSE